jgi:short-subunit dehydrogenase
VGATALVTGASAGIGRALAHEFARGGYELLLVARREDRLQSLAREINMRHGAAARVYAIDLGQPGAGQALFDRLDAEGTTVDVVVNNAGFGAQGTVADLPLDRQLEMIQVNVAALTELTRLFLPSMLQRRRGGILNVASTAAFQPGPCMAVYYATKAYVLSFTEALAEEIAGSGVRVSCLAPGPTATEFAEVAHIEKTRLFTNPPMDAADVAHQGYIGWKKGRLLVIPGAANRRGVLLVKFAPRAWVRRIVKRLNSKP